MDNYTLWKQAAAAAKDDETKEAPKKTTGAGTAARRGLVGGLSTAAGAHAGSAVAAKAVQPKLDAAIAQNRQNAAGLHSILASPLDLVAAGDTATYRDYINQLHAARAVDVQRQNKLIHQQEIANKLMKDTGVGEGTGRAARQVAVNSLDQLGKLTEAAPNVARAQRIAKLQAILKDRRNMAQRSANACLENAALLRTRAKLDAAERARPLIASTRSGADKVKALRGTLRKAKLGGSIAGGVSGLAAGLGTDVLLSKLLSSRKAE